MWVGLASGKTRQVHKPLTSEFIATARLTSDALDVGLAVAAKLRERKTRRVHRLSPEQGKVVRLAEVEIDFTANVMAHIAGVGASHRGPRGSPKPGRRPSQWCSALLPAVSPRQAASGINGFRAFTGQHPPASPARRRASSGPPV